MKLYLHFLAMHLKSRMAYKKSFFFSAIGQFLTSFTAILAVWLLFARFETVQDYTLPEVMLCAAVTLMSFSLAECFFRGFDSFAAVVRSAQFDRILVRPRGTVFQVLCEKVEFARLVKLIQGLLMLLYGLSVAPVAWTPYKALVLVLMVVGGTVVFSALFLLHAGMCFFTLDGLEFMNVFTHGGREFAVYPLDVYGKRLLQFCTWIIPYALYQYYPFLYLLGRRTNPWLGMTPLLTPLFILPCYGVWRFGVRKYKSAGS